MAVHGYFSESYLALSKQLGQTVPAMTAVPYLDATLYIPSTNRSVLISVLLDTGADATVIHPNDSLRLFSPSEIRRLTDPIAMGGSGGDALYYPLQAEVILLHDHGRAAVVPTTVFVAEPTQNVGMDSLLGRDVLGRFAMSYDQAARTVTLD